MARQEEMEILKMLEEGKVSAEEAAKLLDAVGGHSPEDDAGDGQPGAAERARWFRLRVVDGDQVKVNIRIPLFFTKWMGGNVARFIPPKAKEKMREAGVEPETVGKSLAELGKVGTCRLIDVHDDDEHVEAWLE